MPELVRLLIDVIVLCFFAWLIQIAPFPAPMAPMRWVLWAILVVVALIALLPFLGMHV